MDERDKHHFILSTVYSIELTVPQLGTLIGQHHVAHLPPSAVVSTGGGFVITLGEKEATASFDKEADFQPPFSIGFGEGEAMVSSPVIPALKMMCEATEDAIIRLAAAYIR
jgi:hypothetical protein